MKPSRCVAVLAMLVAGLAACGGSGSDEEPGPDSPTDVRTTTPSAEPAEGDTISTDEFSYTAPEGWVEAESSAASLAVAMADSDGFVDNIHVVHDNTVVGVEGDELEDLREQVLTAAEATEIMIESRVQIDGEEAVHTSAVVKHADTEHRTEQYAVSHDETGYVVTVSFSLDVSEAERDEISGSILATWKWES